MCHMYSTRVDLQTITWPEKVNLGMIFDDFLELFIAKVLTLTNETLVSGLVTLQGNTKSCPSFM